MYKFNRLGVASLIRRSVIYYIYEMLPKSESTTQNITFYWVGYYKTNYCLNVDWVLYDAVLLIYGGKQNS